MGNIMIDPNSLFAKVIALGCDPYEYTNPTNIKNIQSGIFLYQLDQAIDIYEGNKRRAIEALFHDDVLGFDWKRGRGRHELSIPCGPVSRDLFDSCYESANTDVVSLSEIDAPYKQKRCLEIQNMLHFGPDEDLIRTGDWGRALVFACQLRFLEGESWDRIENEMTKQFIPRVSQFHEEAWVTLSNNGFLRDRAPRSINYRPV